VNRALRQACNFTKQHGAAVRSIIRRDWVPDPAERPRWIVRSERPGTSHRMCCGAFAPPDHPRAVWRGEAARPGALATRLVRIGRRTPTTLQRDEGCIASTDPPWRPTVSGRCSTARPGLHAVRCVSPDGPGRATSFRCLSGRRKRRSTAQGAVPRCPKIGQTAPILTKSVQSGRGCSETRRSGGDIGAGSGQAWTSPVQARNVRHVAPCP
jgi:hypothetical protein